MQQLSRAEPLNAACAEGVCAYLHACARVCASTESREMRARDETPSHATTTNSPFKFD